MESSKVNSINEPNSFTLFINIERDSSLQNGGIWTPLGKLLKKNSLCWHRGVWNTFATREWMCLFEPQQFRHINVVWASEIFFFWLCYPSSSAAQLIRIVPIFNFTFSTVSFGKFSQCTTSCNAFLPAIVFVYSDFIFHRHSRPFIKSSISGGRSSFDLKTIVGYFQTTMAKEPDSKQERRPLFTADVLAVHVYLHCSLSMVHPKLAPASLFHPLSWLITFDE